MFICDVDVTTKKDTVTKCKFIVYQQSPYPDIQGYSGRFDWRNGDGLFGQFGQPPTGLKNIYQADLLRSDMTEFPEHYDRRHCAGFKDSSGTRPGTIVYRGKDLGEMSITIEQTFFDCRWTTGTERKFIEESIVNPLREFINKHAKPLREEAISRVEIAFNNQLRDFAAQHDKLEKEARHAVKLLRVQR